MKKLILASLIVLVCLVAVPPVRVNAESNFFSKFNFFSNSDHDDDRDDDDERWESSDRDRDDDRDDDKDRDDDREDRGKRKKHGRPPHFEETIIAGTIFDSNGDPVKGDQEFERVTVTCNGVTKTGDIRDDGTYSVRFRERQCDEGDSVTVSAVAEEGTGSSTATVYDDPDEGPCGDSDVTVVNVTVPELGMVGGLVAGLGSMAGYVRMRRR